MTAADTPGVVDGHSRRGPRPRLSKELIVEAAFAISERDGAQALTFQSIGREIEAHPTAIYRHFRDRDDLMLALLDALHAESLASLPPLGDDWAEDLRIMARSLHATFLRHPQVAQISAVRTARREHEFAKVERIVDCMLRAGFPPEEAARNKRAFSDFVLSYSAMDAALLALDPATREADLRAWQVDYQALPAETYPCINAVANHLPALDDPANFERALDLMIVALRLRAEEFTA